jgi:hypothetical protein
MKITNDMLAQFLANREIIKELEQANEVLLIGIKANGGAQTRDYIAVVEDCQRIGVAGKKVFDEKMGHGWLEANKLLTISNYQKVTIAERKVAKVRGES